MPHLHASRLARLSTSLVLALTLAGCTSGDPAGDPAGENGSRTQMDASDVLGGTVPLKTTVSRVLGELSKDERASLEREAAQLIGGYLSAAYLHERPGDGHLGAFPGFTPGARKLALEDVDTLSDAKLARADQVEPRHAAALLSVVAPDGRPVGATARLFLNLSVSEGGRDRLVAVRGRLLLSPAGDAWRIFGYDLSLDLSHKRALRASDR